MKLFVIDGHSIYRRGLVACLSGLEDVDLVSDAGDVAAGERDPELAQADVLLVDDRVPGALEFIRRLALIGRPRVVVCSSSAEEHEVIAAVQAGAVGYLRKDTLTSEALASCVRATADGAGVMAPDLLGALLRNLSRLSSDVLEPRGLSLSRLSEREQEVLRLVAAGHPTREVAVQLSYSERTIKNVLHDVVTKMDARTRSQAVAQAVREGLI
ncbi:MAG: LuxR C-terminal-related transcriptional regulator [Gaiellales bacterium]